MYGPAAVHELRRLGILDLMQEKGSITPNGVCWRASDGSVVARMPRPPPPPPNAPPPDRVVGLPLGTMVELLLEALAKQPTAKLEYGCKVTEVGQDDSSAWVDYQSPTGEGQILQADYVVGCDGGTSTVRHSLFGSSFPGFTWDHWMMACNVRFSESLLHKLKLDDITFNVHPKNWCLVAKIGGIDQLWRVTYGEPAEMSREECAEPTRVSQRIRDVLPGDVDEKDTFTVVSCSPYRVHQRCAPRFRVGRVLLAGDAAHLCNPFGGMGLTSGIVDVGGLGDCLIGLHRDVADETILDRYDEVRRDIFSKIIDGITTANLKRTMQEPEEAIAKDPFIQACRSAGEDAESAAKVAATLRVRRHSFKVPFR